MSPPGTLTHGLRVEHISAVSDTDLTTRTKQMRFLVAELGITRPQAHALLRAYAADQSDAARIGNDTGRSDLDFLAWLMTQQPGGRVRSVKKREWRCAS